jgi:hypothetical protein
LESRPAFAWQPCSFGRCSVVLALNPQVHDSDLSYRLAFADCLLDFEMPGLLGWAREFGLIGR